MTTEWMTPTFTVQGTEVSVQGLPARHPQL